MHTLISLVTLSMLVAFAMNSCDAVNSRRVKRQNIQALIIPREFQNINFENYLKNPRAVQFQLKCVIYDGPCDSIGKYLKANFPNWLSTQCKNCNANQKKQAGNAISFFQKNYPKEWADGVKKYRGNFTAEDVKRFEAELGVKVETSVPEGPAPKPDTDGLAELAGKIIADAKTTPEPLIFENFASTTPASASSTTTAASTTASSAASEAPKASSTKAPTDAADDAAAATTNINVSETTESTPATAAPSP